MEPMTLGSPTHSPSGSPGASFLPSYLMGEFNPPTTPRTGSLSPTKGRTLAFGNSPQARPSPQIQQPNYSTPIRQKPVNNVSFSSKANGPPTLGLFDTINEPDHSNRNIQSPTGHITSPSHFTSPTHTNHQIQQDSFNNSEIQSMQANYQYNFNKNPAFNMHPSISALNPQASNNESFSQNGYNDVSINGNAGEDEYWITVFGFPPSAASIVLTQFSNCGNIAEKKFPPVGNWVWLRFGSRVEAGRALALNGRIFSGGVMIGVLPCSQSPNNTNTPTIRSGPRQLAVGPSRLQNSSVVSPISAAGPGAQRSSGAISRALEYVFGW